jgi:iron complex transport system substrate-binding protein
VSFSAVVRLAAAVAVLAVVSVYAAATCAEPVRATDDAGRQILLSAPARRVVTLAPHLTELVFAAGGAASLAGVDSFSSYPPAAASLPRVGDAAGLDLERILALRPDLIFGWLSGNKPSDIARLEQLRVKLFLSEPRHLDDIPRTLRVMGQLLGTTAAADQQARAFEQRLQAMQVQFTGSQPVPVFFEIWHQPLITVTAQHLISDAITLCGGQNVFGALAGLAPPVSLESVLAADPEVIIATDVPPGALAAWEKHPRVRAVQRKQIYQLAPELITRATPRVLDGTEKICEWLRQARETRR